MTSTVLPPRPRRWALLGIGLSVLLFTIDLSIVNVAPPAGATTLWRFEPSSEP